MLSRVHPALLICRQLLRVPCLNRKRTQTSGKCPPSRSADLSNTTSFSTQLIAMAVVRVGVTPWMHMNPDCFLSDDPDCDEGVELEILYTVASILNITLSLVITNATGCGRMPGEGGSNGTWTGLLGMLRDSRIDMIGNLCGCDKLAYYEEGLFDSSPTVWQYREVLVIRTPEPPAMSFRPFAPFTRSVWIACFLTSVLYLVFILFYRFVFLRSESEQPSIPPQPPTDPFSPRAVIRSLKTLPLKMAWPFWLLFLTMICMIYQTFILSTVLRPFPIFQPFSNSKELSDALYSGRYRLVTHRDPPAVPVACLGKQCQGVFNEAIKKHGAIYIPRASGGQLLSIIAGQDPNARTKYVLVQGEPFVRLYWREFGKERKRLWILEGETSEITSCYVWRKDFRYAKEFSEHIANIGDYKSHTLTRYAHFYGPKPHTGDRYSKGIPNKAISLSRVHALFYLLVSGVSAAAIVYFIEVIITRRRRKRYAIGRT